MEQNSKQENFQILATNSENSVDGDPKNFDGAQSGKCLLIVTLSLDMLYVVTLQNFFL